MVTKIESKYYDIVIVGGGVAGKSAAVTARRTHRRVAIIDAELRNQSSTGGRDYPRGEGLSSFKSMAIVRTEIDGVDAISARAVDVAKDENSVVIRLHDGRSVRGRRVLVATGLVDELPDVGGLRERWAQDVFDCRGIRGVEFTGHSVGILGSGPRTVAKALSVSQWSDRVTLFLHTAPQPTDTEWEQLAAKGICVVIGAVRSLVIEDDKLAGVLLADGHLIPVQKLVVTPTKTAQVATLAGLGLTATPHPVVGGTYLESGANGETRLPEVWLAGSVTDLLATVVQAAESGVRAALAVAADLRIEDVESARSGQWAPFSAKNEAKNTELILGDRRHGLDVTKL